MKVANGLVLRYDCEWKNDEMKFILFSHYHLFLGDTEFIIMMMG
jgi:hypothetical protein